MVDLHSCIFMRIMSFSVVLCLSSSFGFLHRPDPFPQREVVVREMHIREDGGGEGYRYVVILLSEKALAMVPSRWYRSIAGYGTVKS